MTTVVDPSLAPPAAADAWRGFTAGDWCTSIAVRDFINANYTPYLGDASFLAGPTARTTALWARLSELFPAERERGASRTDQGGGAGQREVIPARPFYAPGRNHP